MKPAAEMTFEEALAELEQTVRCLEDGGMTLAESLALYERGQALAARCNVQLNEAELTVRQLTSAGQELPFESI
ncbi:MAG: exodeoxyribonuclease VII small subunit [Anaerolineae bacterium]|nr:exodeoxyribonuclease VII small subunit [Anaerolineae bacterium]